MLILSISGYRAGNCRPNTPFAERVMPSLQSIADEVREEHRRRVLGERKSIAAFNSSERSSGPRDYLAGRAVPHSPQPLTLNERCPRPQGFNMANVENVEAQPEGRRGLMAFLWLLTAGLAGAILALSPATHFLAPALGL